jgi:hypothetical protein
MSAASTVSRPHAPALAFRVAAVFGPVTLDQPLEAAMKRSPAVAAGLVICTLLGVPDIVGMAALGTANAPPAPVLLAGGALGIITVAAVVPACRGHRGSENGRLVLSGASVIATDLVTGDILRQTPNAMAATAAVICPALGGSPAA